MTIELSFQQAFCLAEVFAQTIHHRVMEMHLYVSARALKQEFGEPIHECYTFYKERKCSEFAEMQASIRSLSDRWERQQFIANIRYHFKALREQNQTAPRWQDYVARVIEVRRKEAA